MEGFGRHDFGLWGMYYLPDGHFLLDLFEKAGLEVRPALRKALEANEPAAVGHLRWITYPTADNLREGVCKRTKSILKVRIPLIIVALIFRFALNCLATEPRT